MVWQSLEKQMGKEKTEDQGFVVALALRVALARVMLFGRLPETWTRDGGHALQ